MTVSVQILFNKPQREIASLLRDRLERCTSASLVAGFLTVDGLKAIAAPLIANPGKLAHLVVGSTTWKGFQALDQLLGHRVSPDRLRVHLGHSTPKRVGRATFHAYRPMLHSKVYYMEFESGQAAAFVGSHNLTGFALKGKNGEAAVLLEGPATAPQFVEIRQHIAEAVRQAVQYKPAMKDAYAWWTRRYFEGLRAEADDAPDDASNRNTIVILAARHRGRTPKSRDLIYFEIPEDLGQAQSLNADVHLYLFDKLPPTPGAALADLASVRGLNCKTHGIELGRGGVELRADWYIDNRVHAELVPAPPNFRPSTTRGMQQVRVEVGGGLRGDYEYLFDRDVSSWEPAVDDDPTETVPDRQISLPRLRSMEIVSLDEEAGWQRVVDLVPVERERSSPRELALIQSSPDAGAFILYSVRRRRRDR